MRLRAAATAAMLAVALVPGAARADKAECNPAYEAGQQLRKQSSLREAREKFVVCSADECPGVVKTDCAQWLSEVEQSIPTVTISATDEDGKDLVDVNVAFEGKPLTTKLDGKAIAVDPGPHKFTFESGSRAPITQEFVVREGAKAQQISVSWSAKDGDKGKDKDKDKDKGSPGGKPNLLAPVLVLGGAGVVGMVLFGTFGGLGLSAKSDAETRCKPNCPDSVVDPIKTKFLVADVSLGIGAACLAGAAVVGVIWATSKPSGTTTSREEVPLHVGVAPFPGGAFASLWGSF